jgi:predicted small lipoprotein YifL
MMQTSLRRMTIAAAILAAASIALTGCGRKGDLDPPSTPVEKQNKLNSKAEPVPDKPFLLDPLL